MHRIIKIKATALLLSLLITWAQSADKSGRMAKEPPPEKSVDPTQQIINLLYNPIFTEKPALLYEAFSGLPPAASGKNVLPLGWGATGQASAGLDKNISISAPGSLCLKDIKSPCGIESLAIPIQEADLVIAQGKVHITGAPERVTLKLKWYTHDGKVSFSTSPPAPRANDFVTMTITAKPPQQARWVSLFLSVLPGAESVRLDAPFLGFTGLGARLFTFPGGYHPKGVLEALVRTRLPLSSPWARITREGQRKSTQVHAIQVHNSGYYYYAVDLSRMEGAGNYTLTILDGAMQERTVKSDLTMASDVYKTMADASLAYLKKHLTVKNIPKRGLLTSAQDLLLMANLPAFPEDLSKAVQGLATGLHRFSAAGQTGNSGEAGFIAWALAACGRQGNAPALLKNAQALLYKTWRDRQWAEVPLAVYGLCGAGSILAEALDDDLSRDIADDMIQIIIKEKRIEQDMTYQAGRCPEPWALWAAAAYFNDIPDSNLRPMAREGISAFITLQDRLFTDMPFGQAKVILDRLHEVEIPPWPAGHTQYILANACGLCLALQATPNQRFWYHAARQLQFVAGFNPLGRDLMKPPASSLRSDAVVPGAGGAVRPGPCRLTSAKDALRTHLYRAWTAQAVDRFLNR